MRVYAFFEIIAMSFFPNYIDSIVTGVLENKIQLRINNITSQTYTAIVLNPVKRTIRILKILIRQF